MLNKEDWTPIDPGTHDAAMILENCIFEVYGDVPRELIAILTHALEHLANTGSIGVVAVEQGQTIHGG